MTGVVGVCFHGERGKRHQIDAVTVFQCGEVTVTERQAQHVGNATVVAGCRPIQSASVAPLYVEVVVIAQVSMMMCAPGPRSKMSPRMCNWSMLRRCIRLQIAQMNSSARPVDTMVSMMRLK